MLKPGLIVAMGATAARAVLGRVVKIGETRGAIQKRDDGADVLVTVHPSFLLRLPSEAQKQAEYARFVDDLRLVAPFLSAP
jgi:DNA polymerase